MRGDLMAVLRMTMSHGRTGWTTDGGGAGIQIWTMDCMSDARGGTTEAHSLDQLRIALHVPILRQEKGGDNGGQKPHENPVKTWWHSHGVKKSGCSRQSTIPLILTIQVASTLQVFVGSFLDAHGSQ